MRSVIEFGCGDGNQLSLAAYPDYIGLDISKTAISLCKERFRSDESKSFHVYDPKSFVDNRCDFHAELALSLDVIYHLSEDEIFEHYMRHLFSTAERFVIIYSSDTNANGALQDPYIRHRRFSKWIEANLPDWALLERIPNRYPVDEDPREGSIADFFIYQKN